MPSEPHPPELGADPKQPLLDLLGRAPWDLRISVTDRCNFRCGYCLPRDKVDPKAFLPRAEVLTFEEITRVARLFVGLGTRKIRITGGEPLLRRDLAQLVRQLSELGVELAMTTNGVLLVEHAQTLREAGLHRVTVSLDALDEHTFQTTCDAPGFSVAHVLAGITAAKNAGFDAIKVNCVVRRGENDHQIVPLAQHFAPLHIPVRFIEYMDVGTLNDWDEQAVVSKEEILARLAEHGALRQLPAHTPGEVAVRYAGSQGEVGVIPSVSEPFCGTCCRARLSADGKVYGCLFARSGLDLKSLLRTGASDEQLTQALSGFWSARSDRYSEERQELRKSEAKTTRSSAGRVHLPTLGDRIEMSYIGG